jgi:hypothetical protein
MNAPPIDKQQITLPSAAAIVLLTFGIGAGWTTHEGRFAAQEARLSAMERQNERTERLLNKICGKLQCDAEGMRE